MNPVYNEAIVFDVPPENIEQISLLIAVMDYDRLVVWGHILNNILNIFCMSHFNLLKDIKLEII